MFRNKIYNAIKFAQTKIAILYNTKYCESDFYNSVYIKIIKIEEIEYYLSAENSSFSTKKIDLFKIIRKIKDLAYKLKLLLHIKIHNIISIKYLEQINYNTLQHNILQLFSIKYKNKKLYIIERVIRQKIRDNKLKYIIK